MDPIAIIKLVLIGGIVLNVVSIGVRARPADTLALVRQPELGLRAMLAMFVAVPAFVLVITSFAGLARPVAAVLLALSVAPMPPLISNKERKAGGDADYAIGLQALATAVSLLALPIMALVAGRVFGVSLAFDPAAAVKVLLLTVAAPLAIGMAIGHFLPGLINGVATWGSRIGVVALGLAALVVVVARWSDITARLGGGTLLVTMAIVGFALFIGHRLGGPDDGNRSALAITSAARHPGVAIAVVSAMFPGDAAAIFGMTGLYLLTSTAMTIPYLKWRKASIGL